MTGKELLKYLQALTDQELDAEIVVPHDWHFANATAIAYGTAYPTKSKRAVIRVRQRNLSEPITSNKRIFIYNPDYAINPGVYREGQTGSLI